MNPHITQYQSHSLKTPSFSTVYQPYQSTTYSNNKHQLILKNKQQYQKSKIYIPTTTINNPEQFNSITKSNKFNFNQQKNKQINLTKIIGYDRLLDSLNNFEYKINNNKKNNSYNKTITKYSMNKLNEGIIEDRFIPFRKSLENNYKLKENLIENQQNLLYKDPQSLQISDIYSEEVLGSKQVNQYLDQIEIYQNHNILKYTTDNHKFINQLYENNKPNKKTNSILCEAYSKLRKINKIPCKVLDAPALQDDFYLNLIDWSSQNILAVGLGNSIYLWNASNSKVTKLCELNCDMMSSVSWSLKGDQVAIGCNLGQIQIWDVNKGKSIRKMTGHQMRVGSMSWNSNILATGSRDKSILQRDMRVNRDYVIRMAEHRQQICGLKWSLDQQYLASGGNDNKVIVWSAGGQMLSKFSDHKAAVKALAWSPHQHGLLATGGGTADRMIKMRNVFTGNIICQKDAGSQICNIAFSKSLHEVVSTHGYSQNQINVWSYPNMKKVATLIGHTFRVLYLAISPDGSTIVTGAGDQTLRFWNIFPSVTKTTQKQDCMFNSIEIR